MPVNSDEFNKSAFEYNKSIHDILISICEPVLSNYNIKHFRYMKMFNDYSYLSLGTNLEYLKHYLNNIKEPGKIFEPAKIYATPLLVPKEKEFTYFLWPSNYVKEETDPLYNILYEFNVWNGFTVSRKQANYVETWSFATDKNCPLISQFYINNTQLLDHFILYFQNKLAPFIDNITSDKLAIFQNSFNLNFSIDQSQIQKDIDKFLKDSNLTNIHIKDLNTNVRLTPRELECLFHISMGKTSKKIGDLLNISVRTVETHINSIKAKTNIHFKSDLSSLIPLEELLLLSDILKK